MKILRESQVADFKLKTVTDKSQLDELYNASALTIEGLSKESIKDFINWLKDLDAIEQTPVDVYVISGKVMNDTYGLSGRNKYPDNLTIVSVMNIDLAKVAIPRFQVGGRWFDDIVDNNLARERRDNAEDDAE